ncbi:hypothetical protein [Reichenbachiella sp.]
MDWRGGKHDHHAIINLAIGVILIRVSYKERGGQHKENPNISY